MEVRNIDWSVHQVKGLRLKHIKKFKERKGGIMRKRKEQS